MLCLRAISETWCCDNQNSSSQISVCWRLKFSQRPCSSQHTVLSHAVLLWHTMYLCSFCNFALQLPPGQLHFHALPAYWIEYHYAAVGMCYCARAEAFTAHESGFWYAWPIESSDSLVRLPHPKYQLLKYHAMWNGLTSKKSCT